MKILRKILLVTSIGLLFVCTGNVMAQGGGGGRGGNFDPAQFRQRRLDQIKEAMQVKDDAEWKVLEGAITKVMDAQQEAQQGNRGFGRRPRGGNNNQDAAGGGATANANPPRRGGPPNPDMEALQAALDANAPADEIKTKLAKLRDSGKAKEAKLESAREDLKKLLSARQEAVAVINGLLK